MRLIPSRAMRPLLAALPLLLLPGAAWAQSAPSNIFSAPGGQDLPSQILQAFFSGGFTSGSAAAGTPVFTAFGTASLLQSLLRYYSYGMLVLGSFMMLYYLLRIVAETAHTGRPGGKANQLWGPIRMVLAIGMLVPLPSGLNSGQMVVIQLATAGSYLATNAWQSLGQNYGQSFVPPIVPDQTQAVASLVLVHVCMDVYNDELAVDGGVPAGFQQVQPLKATGLLGSNPTPFEDTIQYGVSNARALCGQVQVPDGTAVPSAASDLWTAVMQTAGTFGLGTPAPSFGYADLQSAITATVTTGYNTAFQQMEGLVESEILQNPPGTFLQNFAQQQQSATATGLFDYANVLDVAQKYQTSLNQAAASSVRQANTLIMSEMNNLISPVYGWLGAGSSFIFLAKAEHMLDQAAQNVPQVSPPAILKGTDDQNNHGVLAQIWTSLFGSTQGTAQDTLLNDVQLALRTTQNLMSVAAKVGAQPASVPSATLSAKSGDFTGTGETDIVSIIKPLITPITGVFNIPNITQTLANLANSAAFPLLALEAVGTLLLKTALACLGAAIAVDVVAKIGLTMALIPLAFVILIPAIGLAYVLPLLPFIHFLFAVLGWLLAFAEAVISVPMFALAHLDPEGEGVMPQATREGYHLLLHLLFRPLLVVLGLIVAMALVLVMTGLLNAIFIPTVAANEDGPGGIFSQLVEFFIYGCLAYAICNACFKAIDYVPNNALRWIGARGDQHESHPHVGQSLAYAAAVGSMVGQVGRGTIDSLERVKANLAKRQAGKPAKPSLNAHGIQAL